MSDRLTSGVKVRQFATLFQKIIKNCLKSNIDKGEERYGAKGFKDKAKICLKKIALSLRHYTIVMLLQATHQLGEVIYDTSSGIK